MTSLGRFDIQHIVMHCYMNTFKVLSRNMMESMNTQLATPKSRTQLLIVSQHAVLPS